MKEFYEDLKAKRIEKGLSLETIHERTRLPLAYLKAIEEGELERLPTGYERVYLRRYVKEIGLPVDEVMRDFELFAGQEQRPVQPVPSPPGGEEPEAPPKEIVDDAVLEAPRPAGQNLWTRIREQFQHYQLYAYFWLALACLVLLAVGYVTYQQYQSEKTHQVAIKEITLSDMIQTLQARDSLITQAMKASTVLKTTSQPGMVVKLKALERTWVREIRDQKDTTDYILPPGIERTIEARGRVNLMLGRADGVEVWLNGKNLGVMGEANQVVVNLSLTPEGIASKVIRTARSKTAARADSTAATPAPAAPTSLEAGLP
ncbi:MAG: helix-turn-helix domain-containing protein [Calditrichaeota bacterium]|nr:MAG: helix-turn-helix domain-containing protein [Calditrichota bacterium]